MARLAMGARGGDYRPAGRRFLVLALFLAAVSAVILLGMLFNRSGQDGWYESLEEPAFNPPSWMFSAVWTPLYVLMALAAWIVWQRSGWVLAAHGAWIVQLLLNLAWTGIFFGLEAPGAALMEIVLLWAAIAVTIALFARHSTTAALLLVPYIAWVTFAAALNFEFWRLN